MTGVPRSNLFSPARRLLAPALALMLCACATSPHGRAQITSPAPISDVYSDAEMRLDLATIPSIQTPCLDEECDLNRAFDKQVQKLGANIAAAAYDAHPDLIKRISHFEFEVAEKKEPGITSNASGKIVILRGTQKIGLNEEALSFVIAREMGHVISQHHDENTTTRILLSVAAGVLFPPLALFGNTAAIAQAGSATSTMLATTAASTATSYLGANLILGRLKPEQLSEADQVALELLERMGWSHQDLARALENSAAFESSNPWSEEFLFSVAQVRLLETASEAIEPLPENLHLDLQPESIATEELEPLEAVALDDAAGTLIDHEDIRPPDLPAPAPLATSTRQAATTTMTLKLSHSLRGRLQTEADRPAKSVTKPVRDMARPKTRATLPKRKATEHPKKSRAGKSAKSKPAKETARRIKSVKPEARALKKAKKSVKKSAG